MPFLTPATYITVSGALENYISQGFLLLGTCRCNIQDAVSDGFQRGKKKTKLFFCCLRLYSTWLAKLNAESN